jgi:uncharacterized protein (TIGR00106 family)
MLAEISVTPIDKTQEGFSAYVAQSIRLIEQSGLDYVLTPMGTIIEGEAEAVFDLIKNVHLNMAVQSERVSTSIKIDDRRGVSGALKSKIESVKARLDEDAKKA